jgi:PAS domain-containing protein
MADWTMHRLALELVPFALVTTNPYILDNPIVFVNKALSALTGCSPEAAVSRNCRFLQGEDTDPEAVDTIRRGVARGGRKPIARSLKASVADRQGTAGRILERAWPSRGRRRQP